jgi:hypothetical protein
MLAYRPQPAACSRLRRHCCCCCCCCCAIDLIECSNRIACSACRHGFWHVFCPWHVLQDSGSALKTYPLSIFHIHAGGDCCEQSCNASSAAGSCSAFWCLDPKYANATSAAPGDDKRPPTINPPANYATFGGEVPLTVKVSQCYKCYVTSAVKMLSYAASMGLMGRVSSNIHKRTCGAQAQAQSLAAC